MAVNMIPRLYEATRKGEIDIVYQYINELEDQLTAGNNNTVLHVAAQYGQLSCVVEILKVCPPSLLHKENCKLETPLHIAARGGDLDIIKALVKRAKEDESKGREVRVQIDEAGSLGVAQALIDRAGSLGIPAKQFTSKELLRATNSDKDTALHIAVQNGHLEIVRFLTTEDHEFSYPANKADETPLYLAVEREDYDMVVAIMEICTSPAYTGPYGRTILHEAAIKSEKPDITTKLLGWKRELIDVRDAHGWTALHYATYCGNARGVKTLLETNSFLGHIRAGEKDDGKIALHMAAAVGDVAIMNEILSACPDCWEMVDNKGHNILHIAAEMEREEVIESILQMSCSSQLINQKSNQGNTPLHLLAASKLVLKMPLMNSDGFWFCFNDKNIRPTDIALSKAGSAGYIPERRIVNGRNMVSNNHDNKEKWIAARTKRLEEKEKAQEDEQKEITQEDHKDGEKTQEDEEKEITQEEHKDKEKAQEDHKDMEKAKYADEMAATHSVVATLIATITFAASFAIPGGYVPDEGPDQGMAVLVRKAAFKVFIITNTVAVLCSTSSVFQYVIASLCRNEGWRIRRYANAFILILLAMLAMMVAFITGTYSMLSDSNALAITTCVIGCLFLLRNLREVLSLGKLLGMSSPLYNPLSQFKKIFSK